MNVWKHVTCNVMAVVKLKQKYSVLTCFLFEFSLLINHEAFLFYLCYLCRWRPGLYCYAAPDQSAHGAHVAPPQPQVRTTFLYSIFSELGTQQYCRDNETMFSGHKVGCYCHITLSGVATPWRHRDLNMFWIFSGPWGSITLSPFRCRKAIKLPCAQLCIFSVTSIPPVL